MNDGGGGGSRRVGVASWRGQVLHNQTGLAVKAALLFEPYVAVTSAPWHLEPGYRPYRR